MNMMLATLTVLALALPGQSYAKKPARPDSPPPRKLASAADFTSTYTKVNDKQSCRYTEDSSDGETRGCTYECNGPAEGLSTTLHSCSDWEHLLINVSGKSYSTWKFMTQGWGAGTAIGTMEWVGRKNGRNTTPIAAIIRFNASNPDTQRSQSSLAVFGFENDGVCFKGNARDNVQARRMATSGACQTKLEESKE